MILNLRDLQILPSLLFAWTLSLLLLSFLVTCDFTKASDTKFNRKFKFSRHSECELRMVTNAPTSLHKMASISQLDPQQLPAGIRKSWGIRTVTMQSDNSEWLWLLFSDNWPSFKSLYSLTRPKTASRHWSSFQLIRLDDRNLNSASTSWASSTCGSDDDIASFPRNILDNFILTTRMISVREG